MKNKQKQSSRIEGSSKRHTEKGRSTTGGQQKPKNIESEKGEKMMKTSIAKGTLPIISTWMGVLNDLWPYIIAIRSLLGMSMILYVLHRLYGILKIIYKVPLCLGECLLACRKSDEVRSEDSTDNQYSAVRYVSVASEDPISESVVALM
jgi:hypothetical protein